MSLWIRAVCGDRVTSRGCGWLTGNVMVQPMSRGQGEAIKADRSGHRTKAVKSWPLVVICVFWQITAFPCNCTNMHYAWDAKLLCSFRIKLMKQTRCQVGSRCTWFLLTWPPGPAIQEGKKTSPPGCAVGSLKNTLPVCSSTHRGQKYFLLKDSIFFSF